MKSKPIQAVVPHLVAVVCFYVVTILFFKPEFMDKKTIAQDDILRYKGVAQQTIEYNKTHDEPTLWTSSMFGGMPVYLFQAEFSDTPLSFLDNLFKGFMTSKSGHMFFMGVFCFYLAMVCFGVSAHFSAVGAIVFGLTTYNLVLIDVGHMTKMWAIAYSPLILAGMYLVFRGKWILGFAIFSLALTLQLRSNHLQITYYLAFVCAVYGIQELIISLKTKELKNFGIASGLLVLGAVLALGANSGRLITTKEYAQYSIRGESELTPLNQTTDNKQGKDGLDREYAFAWSQGVSETMTLLIPGIYGGSSNEKLDKDSEIYQFLRGNVPPEQFRGLTERSPFLYWGDQPFTSAPIYAGAVVCFLFILVLILGDNSQKYWILGGVLITVIFAWGKNFSSINYLLFDHFPLFNKFRSVSMALSLTVLLMTMGAVLGLEQISKMEMSEDLKKKLGIAFGLTGGIALLLFLAGDSFFNFVGKGDANYPEVLLDYIYVDRENMMKDDALRSFFFIAVITGLIFLKLQGKFSNMVFGLVVGIFMIADVWGVGKRYLNEDDFQREAEKVHLAPTPADEVILQDTHPNYRVLNLNNSFQEAQTSYYHKSVGGYFAAKPRRYQDLIERQLGKSVAGIQVDLGKGKRPNFANYKILNMLNTKYIKFSESAKGVLKNELAYGSAWFVEELKAVQNPDEEMLSLNDLNPAQTAVVDMSKFKIEPKKYTLPIVLDSSSIDSLNTDNQIIEPKLKAKLVAYSPKSITYETDNPNLGFLVMSEGYYAEGWEVTLDGKPTDYVRVNYVLRGMEVPAGKHTIQFTFNPKSYETGALLTQVSAILVVLIFIGGLGWNLKKELME